MRLRHAVQLITAPMKYSTMSFAMAVLVLATLPCGARADSSNPIQKVIQLMTKLQAEVIEDGNAAQATYDKFTTWCGRRSKELLHEIEISKMMKLKTEAKIEKAKTSAADASSEVQKLVISTATAGADLKAIKLIREKERKDFEQLDRELTDTLRILEKAQKALEGPQASSFLQRPTQGMKVFTTLIGQVVDAENMISEADRGRLLVLLQGQEVTSASDGEEADEDIEDDAVEEGQQLPSQSQADGQGYTKVSSSSIPKLIKEMQDKTEESQRQVRNKEMQERHNYEMLKARLDSRLSIENKELDAAKKASASALEAKATSEGNLVQIKKDLRGDEEDLHTTQHTCMSRAQEFKIEMEDRKQEMEALAEAKKTIQQGMSGAASAALLHTSYTFFQVKSNSEAAQRGTEGITTAKMLRQLKQLAKDEKSTALMQLSSRITAVLRYSAASGADPFAKVKELVQAMITRLESEMQEEEAQKEFCDKEMSDTEASKEEHEGDIEVLTTRLEKTTNEASKLRQEVAVISAEITDLVKSKAELDALRSEEHAAYLKASQDLKEGFVAVQTALKILREYYNKADEGAVLLQDMDQSMRAASRNPGGGKSIIALLEIVESDTSKSLAEAEAAEDSAQDEYEKVLRENVATQNRKSTDVKQKTAEATALDKNAAQYRGDRQEKEQELDAIIEYYEKLKPQCVQQPETYEERKEKRQREIEGLQQALELLA
mmetsp:Transcript_143093/g.252532  ORF Transcript_143093/g.252532 Transcript_143093/m.252532 type:complete len:721 (+) Transcript_143093:90-2252(+)